MSADNGIYILRTKDQYRVAHLQAVENISWSYIDGDQNNKAVTHERYVPTRVVEMWGDCKFTKDAEQALRIAHKWNTSLPVCEYGVKIITYSKTWMQILKEATTYAKKEMEYIQEQHRQEWCDLAKLQRIADGAYLSVWQRQEQSLKGRKNSRN